MESAWGPNSTYAVVLVLTTIILSLSFPRAGCKRGKDFDLHIRWYQQMWCGAMYQCGTALFYFGNGDWSPVSWDMTKLSVVLTMLVFIHSFF